MKTVVALSLGALIALAASSALAQDETPEISTDVGGGGGGGGGGGRGLGVQVEANFAVPNGPGGTAGLVYDLGAFRFGGGLSLFLRENADTNFGIGLNGWYALHKTRHADFSLGGGIALHYVDPGPGAGGVRVLFEFGGQIRAFVVDNVALLGGLGLGLSVGDGGFRFGLGGLVTGSLGLAYFF